MANAVKPPSNPANTQNHPLPCSIQPTNNYHHLTAITQSHQSAHNQPPPKQTLTATIPPLNPKLHIPTTEKKREIEEEQN
jgi:hypothetical protein